MATVYIPEMITFQASLHLAAFISGTHLLSDSHLRLQHGGRWSYENAPFGET